jgi:hypothetical protein
MKVLGIRYSSSDYTFVVLDGSQAAPIILEVNTVAFPKGFTKPQSLKWFYQEIEGLLARHEIQKIVIKSFEGRFRGNLYEDRVEHEAMVSLAAANRAIRGVFKKVKSTIAKDLGLKGRPRYLSTMDTSMLPEFKSYPTTTKDAVLAAWSELP